MPDPEQEKAIQASGDSKLHPRLRSMLNMHTGPLTVQAELHAGIRIPHSTLTDAVLHEHYPKARTQGDPRLSSADTVNLITSTEMDELDRQRRAAAASSRTRATPAAGTGPSGADPQAGHEPRPEQEPEADQPEEPLPPPKKLAASPKLKGEQTSSAEFSVFVQLEPDIDHRVTADDTPGGATADVSAQLLADVHAHGPPGHTTSRRRDLLVMTARARSVRDLARLDGVASVESGDGVRKLPVSSAGAAAAPSSSERQFPTEKRHHGYGADVVVGVIDVEGFDFAHPDFSDNGQTRFAAIWDQGADPSNGARPSPHEVRASTLRVDYGSEITRTHMNAALAAAADPATPPIPATTLEPQTSMIPGSHGTHVASIAAGNHGVCREAEIVGVSLALADGDHDRRRSFYDTSRLAHAIDYIIDYAEQAQKPVSINISLGTNGHSHDGSAVISRWIDYAVATPGRAVTVAAGNAGQTVRSANGGIGHLLGRIHASGRIAGAALRQELDWQVFGNGLADVSTNEMEIWYPAQDLIAVQLTSPDGQVFGPISPGHELVNFELSDHTRVSIHNDRYHPVNGFNRISLFLTPFFATDNQGMTAVVGVQAGTWTVQLIGQEIRDGSWHAWIERDDPNMIGDQDGVVVAFYPSAFAEGTFDAGTQVSTLACGEHVNSVANLDAGQRMVNGSSSRGPTRTGDPKPDLCAPGTDIVAAAGFTDSSTNGAWTAMTGTSMASPYVTGVVGLMLAIDPKLTAPQISSILRRTSSPLPGHTFEWQDDAGFGEIDPVKALEETAAFEKLRSRS